MANIEKFPLEARGETVSREALVQAALHEITQNYREASLSNVARSYGVSLAYVSECVRAQTGKTYKELLQKHRMETAARLLRRSDWNIQQIITYVGYENTSYFYRLFHERYGVSPREYRRSRTPRVRASAGIRPAPLERCTAALCSASFFVQRGPCAAKSGNCGPIVLL